MRWYKTSFTPTHLLFKYFYNFTNLVSMQILMGLQ